MADHLSRLESAELKKLINEEEDDRFPEERLLMVNEVRTSEFPWFANIANWIVGQVVPSDL